MRKKGGLMRLSYGLAAGLIGLSVSQTQAQSIDGFLTNVASTLGDVTDTILPGVTNIRIGIGPVYMPAYEGSDDYKIKAAPLISLRYRDLIRIDNNRIRVNVFGSESLFRSENFKAGPMVKLDFGRDQDDSTDLAGLGNVGTSLELGLFASYTAGPTRIRVRGRQDVASGHSGMLITTDLGVSIYRDTRLTVTGSLSATWADNDYMDSYFSVTATQASASGLTAYNASSSFKDVTFAVGANYAISHRWNLAGNAGYSKLLKDAKNSPIVSVRGDSNQFVTGLFAIYSF